MEQTLAFRKHFDLTARFLKYWAAFKTNYFTNTAYSIDLWAIGATVMLRTWLFYQLYGVVFRQQGATEIGGFTLPMTIWSLALAQSFLNSSRIRLIIRGISEEIQSGYVAYNLSRPYGYIIFSCCVSFGRIAANLLATISLAAVACLILVGPVHITLPGLLAGALLLFGGLLILVLQCVLLGMIGFWTEETAAFERIYQKANLIFGGVILPLTMFPERLRAIAELLPFSQAFYAPTRMLFRFEPELFIKLLSVQAFWLAISIFFTVLVFKKGVKNVRINGG